MFGLNQAEHGPESPVRFSSVKRTNQIEDDLWAARQILAANLYKAMARVFKDEANRPVALMRKTDVGQSVIKRLLKPKTKSDPYPTLETLVRLAGGLGISVFELVIDAHDMRGISSNKTEIDDHEDVEMDELRRRRRRSTSLPKNT